MEIFNQLKDIGLSKSEISVYLYLLENGLSTPPQVAKGTKIARTNCYNILQGLKDGKLINEQVRDNRKAYIASNPEALLRSIERKKEAIEQILPDLKGLFTIQKNKPKIKFYEGIEGIKEIFEESLSADKILGFASTEKLFSLDPKFFLWHQRQLKKNNIVFYDILSHDSKEKAAPETINILKGLYNVKFIDKRYGPVPTDILIWDDEVVLMTLEEPIFATMVTNKPLADTFRIMFDVMWEGLE